MYLCIYPRAPRGALRGRAGTEAAEDDNPHLLRLLIVARANINAGNRNGRTALSFAVAPSNFPDNTRRLTASVQAISCLITYRADPHPADSRGRVPLDWAVHARRYDAQVVLNSLLAQGYM
jgi:ankyrin repeat protein